MASTTSKVYKLDVTGTDGTKRTLSVPNPIDDIDGDTLAGASANFIAVGYKINSGQYVTTTTDSKIYPSA